jgi:hypothetical protein
LRLLKVVGNAVALGKATVAEQQHHDQHDQRGACGLAGFLDRAVDQLWVSQTAVAIEREGMPHEGALGL